MEESAGIYRTGSRANLMPRARRRSGRLQAHAQRLRLEDRSRTFNTELTAALELGYMLELAQVILEESSAEAGRPDRVARGAPGRTDHPQVTRRRAVPGPLARVSGRTAAPPRIEYVHRP